ncbi:hypothetical protein [Ornithinimicrobium sp. W1665]|uniref:hypothetical protein n=1 Tax=Ornithinimicrobium sp. W1665 TaxID=3416666 RepID=UPI003CFA61D9
MRSRIDSRRSCQSSHIAGVTSLMAEVTASSTISRRSASVVSDVGSTVVSAVAAADAVSVAAGEGAGG